MDRLAQIFERQALYLLSLRPIYEKNGFKLHASDCWPLDFQGRAEQEEFRLLAWRFTEEMMEAMETFENASPRLDYHEEISDALHFLVELCLATGISCNDLVTGIAGSTYEHESGEDSLDFVFRKVSLDKIYSTKWYSTVRAMSMAMMQLRQRPWRTDNRESNRARFVLMMQATFFAFINTCTRTGMNAEDLHRAYFAKARINDQRTVQQTAGSQLRTDQQRPTVSTAEQLRVNAELARRGVSYPPDYCEHGLPRRFCTAAVHK